MKGGPRRIPRPGVLILVFRVVPTLQHPELLLLHLELLHDSADRHAEVLTKQVCVEFDADGPVVQRRLAVAFHLGRGPFAGGLERVDFRDVHEAVRRERAGHHGAVGAPGHEVVACPIVQAAGAEDEGAGDTVRAAHGNEGGRCGCDLHSDLLGYYQADEAADEGTDEDAQDAVACNAGGAAELVFLVGTLEERSDADDETDDCSDDEGIHDI